MTKIENDYNLLCAIYKEKTNTGKTDIFALNKL